MHRTGEGHGATFIDTLVGIAIMALVFVGIAGVFQLALSTVTNNKARTTAIALAMQRLEYVHSISYASIGMQHGIPSGVIPETENVTMNGVAFVRKTYIEYDDDPRDGLGASDTNGIPEDYKMIKVDVSWITKNITRHVTFSTRISPQGIESIVPGGTLSLLVTNSSGVPLPGAVVRVINNALTPSVDETLLTDASGTAVILGAPTSTAYQVSVTEPGYSTAQTYGVSAQNTSPTPSNLTVTNNNVTGATFAIDVLGSMIMKTLTQIVTTVWQDKFDTGDKIEDMASTTFSGATVVLSSNATYGTVLSVPFGTSSIVAWKTIDIVDTVPASTSIIYQVYDPSRVLIPDTQLPGNSTGFSGPSIDISTVSTSSYPRLAIGAILTTANTSTPAIDSWSATYMQGGVPIPSISLGVVGSKSIGSGPKGTVYKFSTTTTSGTTGTLTLPSMEWDSYTISVSSSTGYDVASACNPQPQGLTPGATLLTSLYLATHTPQSLLVDVHLQNTGVLLQGANVTLTRASFSVSSVTDHCGQVFFPNLTNASDYTLTIVAEGHATTTINTVNVSGTSRISPLVP